MRIKNWPKFPLGQIKVKEEKSKFVNPDTIQGSKPSSLLKSPAQKTKRLLILNELTKARDNPPIQPAGRMALLEKTVWQKCRRHEAW
ncbi:conserved hypothetical protein [Ricinus communis]|uniref:Uncharacterized protein n=1 Tax=Ricinus communis TaxID=3988 RepID=B9RRJ5_RICCO|nr:conserved hypothetical protein [Ricinus communis]